MNVDLQQKVVATRAELQSLKAQAGALRRSKQLAEITQKQVHAEKPECVWQGIGRSFLRESPSQYDENVRERQAQLDAKLSALEKREVYLSTTLEKLVMTIQNMS